MVSFAGYEMPLEYTGINEEHLAVRRGVGLFDVSHMGEIWIRGRNALAFLQRVSSNDASALVPGKAQYSCLPNGRGGIVDDLIVHQYDESTFLLVVNASNIEKDWAWLVSHQMPGVELENRSDCTAQLALQGPLSKAVLQKITPVNLSSLHSFHFTEGQVGEVSGVMIAATGYTGAGGYELYFDERKGLAIWDRIMDAGKEWDLKPIGLAARDTLRLEMGYCLYGNDIDDTTSPIEAGLGWITKLTETKDLIDKQILMDQKVNGVSRKLVGFKMIDRGIPRHLYEIYDDKGGKIGTVTSGTMSPSLKEGIGMGYVKTGWDEPGKIVFIGIRNHMLKAEVVRLPFIRNHE